MLPRGRDRGLQVKFLLTCDPALQPWRLNRRPGVVGRGWLPRCRSRLLRQFKDGRKGDADAMPWFVKLEEGVVDARRASIVFLPDHLNLGQGGLSGWAMHPKYGLLARVTRQEMAAVPVASPVPSP